jgi:hypothetical protein
LARPFKTVEPVPLEGKSSPVSFRKLAELRTLDTHLNPVSALHLKGDEIGRIRVMVHVAVLVVCMACSMVTFGYNVSIHRQQGLFIGIGPFPVHAEPGYGNNDGNYGKHDREHVFHDIKVHFSLVLLSRLATCMVHFTQVRPETCHQADKLKKKDKAFLKKDFFESGNFFCLV